MRRPLLFVALATVVLVGVWWDQRLQRSVAGADDGAVGQWIWSASDAANQNPTAFLLVRTFDIGSDLLDGRAILRVAGDPAARVDCNGLEVLTLARPIDDLQVAVAELDVTEALHVGANRIAVETGSVTGAGGVWLELRLLPEDAAADAAGTLLVASDEQWQTVRHPAPGIREGWRPVRFAEPAQVWGPPGIGRWGDPRSVPVERRQWRWVTDRRSVAATSLQPTSIELPGPTPGSRIERRAWRVRFAEPASGRLQLTFDPPADAAELVWPEDLELLGPNAHELLVSPERRPPHAIRPLGGIWRDARVREVEEVLVIGPRPGATVVVGEGS